jgi:hypothetical protein
VHSGARVVVRATLRNAVTWAPRPGLRLVPCTRRHATVAWHCRPAVRTSRTGVATLVLHPTRGLDVRWRFAGATGAPAATSPVVTLAVTRAVSLSLSASRVRTGHLLTVRGAVRPAARLEVRLQHYQGGRWRDLLTGRTTRTGSFGFRVKLYADGTRYLRAYVPAAGGLPAAGSARRAVTVVR